MHDWHACVLGGARRRHVSEGARRCMAVMHAMAFHALLACAVRGALQARCRLMRRRCQGVLATLPGLASMPPQEARALCRSQALLLPLRICIVPQPARRPLHSETSALAACLHTLALLGSCSDPPAPMHAEGGQYWMPVPLDEGAWCASCASTGCLCFPERVHVVQSRAHPASFCAPACCQAALPCLETVQNPMHSRPGSLGGSLEHCLGACTLWRKIASVRRDLVISLEHTTTVPSGPFSTPETLA
jgi:hypothetical protein